MKDFLRIIRRRKCNSWRWGFIETQLELKFSSLVFVDRASLMIFFNCRKRREIVYQVSIVSLLRMIYGLFLSEGCMFSQCSHGVFFQFLSLNSHVLGQLEAPTYPRMSLAECDMGPVKEHVPTLYVKTIPAMGLHTGCCCDQEKCWLTGEGGRDGWMGW